MSNIQPSRMYSNFFMCPVKVLPCVTHNNCIMKVGGKGTIMAEPDKASVILGVVTENMQLENAQSDNAQKMLQVIETLTKLGIKREEIRTQSYQIQPQYDYPNGGQVFTGYRVVHEVRVEISNIDTVGSIIDEAVRAGANTVGDIRFSISEPQKYYEIALSEALSNATDKAASIGRKMSLYVNPVPASIMEQTAPVIAPLQYMSTQAANTTTPIQPGRIEITAMVEVEFTYACNRV